MYCLKCGKEINDDAVICPHCGCTVKKVSVMDSNDAPSTGFAVLGFLFPLIGLCLYLANKNTAPLKAKSAGKGAIIGFCVTLVFSLILGTAIGSTISMYI